MNLIEILACIGLYFLYWVVYLGISYLRFTGAIPTVYVDYPVWVYALRYQIKRRASLLKGLLFIVATLLLLFFSLIMTTAPL